MAFEQGTQPLAATRALSLGLLTVPGTCVYKPPSNVFLVVSIDMRFNAVIKFNVKE